MTIRTLILPLTASALLGFLLWRGLGLDPLLSWLIAINLATLLTYGYDKSIAGRGSLRVPERTLLLLALAGGSLGAYLGMRIFHHKTAKGSFQRRFWLVVAIQAVLVLIYVINKLMRVL